jgi:hypothetical protein
MANGEDESAVAVVAYHRMNSVFTQTRTVFRGLEVDDVGSPSPHPVSVSATPHLDFSFQPEGTSRILHLHLILPSSFLRPHVSFSCVTALQ